LARFRPPAYAFNFDLIPERKPFVKEFPLPTREQMQNPKSKIQILIVAILPEIQKRRKFIKEISAQTVYFRRFLRAHGLRNKRAAEHLPIKKGKVINMKTKLFLSLALAAAGGGNVFAAPARKITMERAQEIALQRVGGEVEQAAMVKRRYHKPAYSIFIKKSNGVTAHVLVSEKGRIKRVADETTATAKIK
jgi:uncharacterized membrane protein YkoI